MKREGACPPAPVLGWDDNRRVGTRALPLTSCLDIEDNRRVGTRALPYFKLISCLVFGVRIFTS